MIYAGILSGGVGTRMQRADMPKQFLELGDKPILIHTIDPFMVNYRIDEIIVALPRSWISYTIDLVRKYYPDPKKIHLIAGGETRNETLMCVLNDIEQRNGIGEDDVIISHDAIRPFISDRIINDNIEAVQKYGAVDTVIPAFDTIVESADGETICNIPVRSRMYQGQTPQSFHIKTLQEVYAQLTPEEVESLTDAAKIFVLKGKPVHMVAGDFSNMKITTPYDLKMANALLKSDVL